MDSRTYYLKLAFFGLFALVIVLAFTSYALAVNAQNAAAAWAAGGAVGLAVTGFYGLLKLLVQAKK